MTTPTSRRHFFRTSLDELLAVVDECQGTRSFTLSSLDTLGDVELGRLVPAIMDASGVVGNGELFVFRPANATPEVLFAAGSKEEDVWARMDGRASLQEIAAAHSLEFADTLPIAFARTKRLFLRLIRLQICRPRNPLE